MKICLNCGNTNEDNLDLCKQCGTVLKKEEIAQPPIEETNKEV